MITRDALHRILGVAVNNVQWGQAQLPVKMGGIGLRAATDHAPAAYVMSLIASHDLQLKILGQTEEQLPLNINQDLLTILSWKQNEEATLDSLYGMSQKAVSEKIDKLCLEQITKFYQDQDNTREVARMMSVGLEHSGDWLNVIPSLSLGLHMRSVEFVTSVRYRLGCQVYPADGTCPACKLDSDKFGDHAISCGSDGERIARHNTLRNALYSTARTGCLAPVNEASALIPVSRSRPADVLLPNWTAGKDTALDVTVVNPLQAKLVDNTATNPGSALQYAYNWKMKGAGEACRQEGIVFLPMPVETLGGWHEEAANQVKKLAVAKARQKGEDQGDSVRRLFQLLSVLLVKGNAALFLSRDPTLLSQESENVEK